MGSVANTGMTVAYQDGQNMPYELTTKSMKHAFEVFNQYPEHDCYGSPYGSMGVKYSPAAVKAAKPVLLQHEVKSNENIRKHLESIRAWDGYFAVPFVPTDKVSTEIAKNITIDFRIPAEVAVALRINNEYNNEYRDAKSAVVELAKKHIRANIKNFTTYGIPRGDELEFCSRRYHWFNVEINDKEVTKVITPEGNKVTKYFVIVDGKMNIDWEKGYETLAHARKAMKDIDSSVLDVEVMAITRRENNEGLLVRQNNGFKNKTVAVTMHIDEVNSFHYEKNTKEIGWFFYGWEKC